MRFEDYLDRELYLSICKENANRRKTRLRQYTRNERREKNRRIMTVLTVLCIIALFLLLCFCFLTQKEPEVQAMESSMVMYSSANSPENSCITNENQDIIELDPVQEDFENERIQEALIAKANRINNVKVTFYCTERYEHICNAGAPYKTACGNDVIPDYTCAVDPKTIPLGSTVFVDFGDGEIHEYFADDTGGAINGTRIDLAVETHDEALECGIKTATVWWIKE